MKMEAEISTGSLVRRVEQSSHGNLARALLATYPDKYMIILSSTRVREGGHMATFNNSSHRVSLSTGFWG
jgi:hypothetical protein